MPKLRYTILFIVIIALNTFGQNDFIYLLNGENAPITIIDTTGCEVSILRRGNKVRIKKTDIFYIVKSGDTILYSDYVCKSTPSQPHPYTMREKSEIIDSGECEKCFRLMFNKYPSLLEAAFINGDSMKYTNNNLADCARYREDLSNPIHKLARYHLVWGGIDLAFIAAGGITTGVLIKKDGWNPYLLFPLLSCSFPLFQAIHEISVGHTLWKQSLYK